MPNRAVVQIAGGAFSFTGLTPGDYYVCFITTPTTAGGSSSTGYVNVCWQDVQIPFGISPSDLTHGTVADGANTGGIVQAMPAGGAITGTVTDDGGRFIAATCGTVRVASIYVPNGGKDFPAKMRFLGRPEHRVVGRRGPTDADHDPPGCRGG